MDYASGKVLSEGNADEKLDPASLTKIMTPSRWRSPSGSRRERQSKGRRGVVLQPAPQVRQEICGAVRVARHILFGKDTWVALMMHDAFSLRGLAAG
jgi:hypothetical protein